MTKKELAEKLSLKMQVSEKQALGFIDNFAEIVIDEVKNNNKITLKGFAIFKQVIRKPKVARNISRGTSIIVPEKKVAKIEAKFSIE